MRRLLVTRFVQRIYEALNRGDPGPALALFVPSTRLTFAGTHSWSIDSDDQATIAEWFQRFAALRPRLRAHDVVVSGPPWRTSVCVVFDDSISDSNGREIYRNHGVQYLRLRWNRVVLDEINLDTQKVAAFVEPS
jgi:ketosteroid isomerase-like protein